MHYYGSPCMWSVWHFIIKFVIVSTSSQSHQKITCTILSMYCLLFKRHVVWRTNELRLTSYGTIFPFCPPHNWMGPNQTIEVYIGLTWKIIATLSTSTQWKQMLFNNIVIPWCQTAERIQKCERNTLCKSCDGKVHSGITAGHLWTNMVRIYNLSMPSSCYYPQRWRSKRRPHAGSP